MKLEALIFDVDGTLAETEELHRQSFNLTFQQFKLDWDWNPEIYAKLLQTTGGKERMIRYVKDYAPDQAAVLDQLLLMHKTKTRSYLDLLSRGALKLRPGIERLVYEAQDRDIKLAIATTSTPINVKALLRSTLGEDSPNWFANLGGRCRLAQKAFARRLFRSARSARRWTRPCDRIRGFDERPARRVARGNQRGRDTQPLSGRRGSRRRNDCRQQPRRTRQAAQASRGRRFSEGVRRYRCAAGASRFVRSEGLSAAPSLIGAAVTDDFLVTRCDGIVTATFNRPSARNALTFAMYEALATLCGEIDADPDVKVLIVTGAGGEAFAAGTDIAQFEGFKTDADALAYEARIERVLCALERCRVPTLAAIAGACTGGGAAIAGCCDIRLGASNLKFGFPIARTLGNCLSVENVARLVALMGEARVKDMIYTARLYQAEEALAAGLISEIVVPADLGARSQAMARIITSHAALTILSTKRSLAHLRATVVPADDLVLMCYRSRDFREGVAAFREKRRPLWEGC